RSCKRPELQAAGAASGRSCKRPELQAAGAPASSRQKLIFYSKSHLRSAIEFKSMTMPYLARCFISRDALSRAMLYLARCFISRDALSGAMIYLP
ncbi:MAG TPA: hypothetical protein PKZ32_13130, partial [Candidatus Melainabacteria bacterium]|nr:hypothetical protein [Candidatus Melainabacteria bacterium]